MMGDKDWRFPRDRANLQEGQRHPGLKLQEDRQKEFMMQTRTDDFPGFPAPPSGSQGTRRGTRGVCMMGGKDCQDLQHHHPVPQLENWETKTGDFPGPPASGSQAARRDTRGNYAARHGLAISPYRQQNYLFFLWRKSGTPAVNKLWRKESDTDGRQGLDCRFPSPPAPSSGSHLQERRQEETITEDKDWRFPVSPGTTTCSVVQTSTAWGRKRSLRSP